MKNSRWKLNLLFMTCLAFFVSAPAALALTPYTQATYTGPAKCDVTPGTVITKQNWMQYKDCFSVGVQQFFMGDLFWKMPDDVEMHVRAPEQWTLPKPFIEASEKYGSQTRLEPQPNGEFKLENYVAGWPFPNPNGPLKGTEIMANDTYKMQGYSVAVFHDLNNIGAFYTKDRFGNWSPEIVDGEYNQTAYNWESDQGIPQTDPLAAGTWYTEWIMVWEPEQSKYTAVLTLFWQDNLKEEDDYTFVPALRRTLRLSSSARCAPLLGSDMVKDDQRVGWNGGVGKFEGTWLRDQKLLTLSNIDGKVAGVFPGNYDGFLGWAKPSWGDWETRDVNVVDVHRIASLAPGYCYGKRIDYVDKQYYVNQAEDIYDTNMQLWKVMWAGYTPGKLDNYGEQYGACGIIENYWDVQNDHVSYVTTFNPSGSCVSWDQQIPPRYRDLRKYATPAGLAQMMR